MNGYEGPDRLRAEERWRDSRPPWTWLDTLLVLLGLGAAAVGLL